MPIHRLVKSGGKMGSGPACKRDREYYDANTGGANYDMDQRVNSPSDSEPHRVWLFTNMDSAFAPICHPQQKDHA